MLIAICDDEKVFRDELKMSLKKYKTENHLCIDICQFSSGEDLLDSNEIFDMVFLDYQMPGLDGMDVARKLRAKNIICNIVFITNYPQFMLESFEVQPYRFYIKPLLEEQLISLMNTYIAQQKLLSPIIVINDNEQKIINAKDIMYLEGDGKYCVIRTSTDTYHSSKTLAQVHALLPQHCFYRTHKSYVINLYCVDSFSEKCIITTNNEKVSVGRNKIAEFKRIYANFIKNYFLRT